MRLECLHTSPFHGLAWRGWILELRTFRAGWARPPSSWRASNPIPVPLNPDLQRGRPARTRGTRTRDIIHGWMRWMFSSGQPVEQAPSWSSGWAYRPLDTEPGEHWVPADASGDPVTQSIPCTALLWAHDALESRLDSSAASSAGPSSPLRALPPPAHCRATR